MSENAGIQNMSIAFDSTVTQRFMGQSFESRQLLIDAYPTQVNAMWIGVDSPGYVTPTNPYVRDKNNQAIVNGRLTIEKYNVSLSDTGGVTFTLNTLGRGEYPAGDYTGRQLSRKSATLGIQPIVTTSVSIPVGRENREFSYTIKTRQWMPVSITAIEYQSRFLYNSRRI